MTTQFVIDDSYSTKGLGLILCGTMLKGEIVANQPMMFGPDKNGVFKAVTVKEIQHNRVSIDRAVEGMQVTFKVKQTGGKNTEQIKGDHMKKGSMLINPLVQQNKQMNPYRKVCSKYFLARISIKNHHTTISQGYSAVCHNGGTRQTVQAEQIEGNGCMRIGDTGLVLFKMQYGVAIINEGERIMLREGATRAVGYITKTFNLDQDRTDFEKYIN